MVQDRYYLTDEYMREVLEHMSIAQLIDTILINPTVHIAPSYRDTGLSATYTFQPLSNLVYTRDQQARFLEVRFVLLLSHSTAGRGTFKTQQLTVCLANCLIRLLGNHAVVCLD